MIKPARNQPNQWGEISIADADVWEAIIAKFKPKILHQARAAGLQPSDAADVTQDVFRIMAKHAPQDGLSEPTRNCSEEPKLEIQSWVSQITRNVLNRFMRRSRKRPVTIDARLDHANWERLAPQLCELHSASWRDDSQFRVRQALQAIKADFQGKTWQAFWRMTMHQEQATAIAEDLKMDARAVRQAKFRVMSRLRDELKCYADEE
ncbi:RNA polymerase sigma factor [Stieleria varia]|uniref:RNA polymerase sigma factor n=1 Tax=Stieleria varia TaxID=2528005 RepID=A0A5C6B181_9BACT|nr:sigma-70 family RNA polymerase sigma factor [Stieleria varia]TWU05628.1 hypothetical protein Pla52n_13430 [Stieleria varia]